MIPNEHTDIDSGSVSEDSNTDPNLVVAGKELGGVVRSADGGETWQDQRSGVQADCHALFAHPGAPEILYEAGGGFAQSADFGKNAGRVGRRSPGWPRD
jgi:hypothetical protein